MRVPVFVLTLLLSLSVSAEVRVLTGEALVRNAGSNAIAILLDTNGDKSIDQGFLLESELAIHVPQTVHVEKGRLTFDDGYVRLFAGDTMYELYVAGYPDPPAQPSNMKAIRYTGYGITHRAGETRYDIAKAERDEKLQMPGWE